MYHPSLCRELYKPYFVRRRGLHCLIPLNKKPTGVINQGYSSFIISLKYFVFFFGLCVDLYIRDPLKVSTSFIFQSKKNKYNLTRLQTIRGKLLWQQIWTIYFSGENLANSCNPNTTPRQWLIQRLGLPKIGSPGLRGCVIIVSCHPYIPSIYPSGIYITSFYFCC